MGIVPGKISDFTQDLAVVGVHGNGRIIDIFLKNTVGTVDGAIGGFIDHQVVTAAVTLRRAGTGF